MAEKKLSEELRHCLDGKGCDKCSNYQSESRLTCPALLEKAYEVVKRHEEMFPCKVGDIVYNLVPKVINSTYREDIVSRIVIDKYSVQIQFENGLSKDIKQLGKTVFLTKEVAEKELKEMEDRENE